MTEDLYMRVAYAALVLIFMFCGVLRCCNLWPQYGKSPDELYPARRIVVCAYFSVLLLLPCILYPHSPDARLFARCFWILYIPAVTSLAFKRFFYGDARHTQLRIALVGGVPFIVALVMSCVAMGGGERLSAYGGIVVKVAGALGAVLTAYQLHVTLWLWHLITCADARSSDDSLFPRNFALGMFILSVSVQTLIWVEFFFGNQLTNTVFAAAIAFIGAVVVLVILHPQRLDKTARRSTKAEVPVTEAEVCAVPAPGNAVLKKLSMPVIDRIESQIRDAMERDRMFLDSDVSVAKLSARVNVNEKYLNAVLRHRFGKFNAYISILRLKYSIHYIEEHPDAKIEEVAISCGFGSVRTYYRVKNDYMKEVENILRMPKG